MGYEFTKSMLRAAAFAVGTLLAAGVATAQTTTVDLTAMRMSATLPDGNTAKMWGYCNTVASPAPATLPAGSCPAATDGTGAWLPGPTIVVPSGNSLTINLTNKLPTLTSLVIVGQLGGGLGAGGATLNDVPRVASPQHAASQPITWPAADPTAGFTPPTQGARARAFGAEVAVDGTATYTWAKLRPGTYLYETGSTPSLQAPMGLYGVLIVTQAPTAIAAGVAYPNIAYDADTSLLFSEIDLLQNAAVDAAALVAADVTKLFNDASCTTTAPCYPPAVNYAPTYFLINGQAFNPTAPSKSGFALSDNVTLTGGGKVLVRLVNAGLRTHVPTIVGLPAPLQIVAEDGFILPGKPKSQTHVLMPAGKTFDVTLVPNQTVTGTYDVGSFPIFDRALSLTSSNITNQTALANSGMFGFIAVQPAGSTAGQNGGASVPAAMLATAVNDSFAAPAGGSINGNVLANDVNVVSAAVMGTPPTGLSFNSDGSFVYTAGGVGTVTFMYQGNGATGPTATVTITVGGSKGTPVAVADTGAAAFTSKVASFFKANAPGVLANDTDPGNLALKAVKDSNGTCSSVSLSSDGSFTAVPGAPGATCTFQYHVQNSLGDVSAGADATVTFVAGSGLAVTVKDTQDPKLDPIADYSWVIEEDATFFHDPADPAGKNAPNGTLATNFHKSYMPVVASGCTGPNSCGTNSHGGAPDASPQREFTFPKDVALDPNKRYYISILPGDADQGDATYNGDGTTTVNAIGHTMGGVSIASGWTSSPAPVAVLVPRNPLPPAQMSVYVFEDSLPTNGAVDANEPGLGGFTINLYDTRGSSGDPAGLMTYDLSGMPFTNSLANRKDSATGVNLCPMNTPSGTIITCPALGSDGQPSTLAGMALIKNIIPGRYDVWATPGADRAANGENWVQVSTLEGTHANDTFVKPGEKAYWQEFGPPGFHSFIGFVNPDHVAAVNKAQGGTATINGRIPSLHMDRPTPLMANLNSSCATADPTDKSCRATLNSTTCYVGVNSVAGTGATVALATCDEFGNFTLKNVPVGSHSLVIWDQWLDQIIAYKAVTVATAGQTVNMGDVPVFSWFTRIEQSAFVDLNQNGVRDSGEPGVSQIPMNVRFRDGSVASFLTTDSTGSVTANELFPLFNWYVVESDTTRYAGTGVHTVYDAGGKPDTASITVTDLKGNQISKDFSGVLNSNEAVSLPTDRQVAGAKYTSGKTSRIDPGTTLTEGTQGFINQTAVIDWGKRPYAEGETGGITGLVYYASTRGFDDPSLEVQFSWEPAVPRVPVNLYQVVKNADGSESRILVDHTTTWSWDDAAASLNCPGDPDTDPFIAVTIGTANQFKCYDGQHNFNQIQPTVYDGRYRFPSANCIICTANPANSLPGKPTSVTYPNVLPKGKYVVELVVPSGYEIVKEEDKNILIGDSWIAPAEATQFFGVGNIFIVPDQATLNDANVVGSNLNSGFPPCIGALHRVPDFLTLFPGNQQIAPYAGQDRPLCDHKLVTLSDQSQASADFQVFTQTPIAGHITGIMLNDAAAEFDPTSPAFLEKASLPNAPISVRDYNGVEIARVYNDKWGTFNNLVPSTWQANVPNPSGYGPNMLTFCMNDPGPIADPAGTLDPKTGKVRTIADPSYNPMFSNFCYVWPSMPGITTYLDTPVLPTSAYASASTYEPVDCAYPDSTPAIYRVDGTEIGPFIDLAKPAPTLTISALGDVLVNNPAYEGPQASSPPIALQPKVKRHYGFGSAVGRVTINGINIPVTQTQWTDGTITLPIPAGTTTGQLVITTASGSQSIDTVNVTIAPSTKPSGYRAPIHVSAPASGLSGADALLHPIQDALDASQPGDLIILDAGNYPELVVMDHPVRLQGVGAAAVVISAAKFPNQKIDAWRTRINNAFGLDNQGNTLPGVPAVDPLPGQEITGGILLLEPSVLATEEGAGITVLAKGYEVDGITPLKNNVADCAVKGNFLCASSRIDGISVTGGDSGGGIYVNGWAHNLEISNNRVFGNAGMFNGGVRIGQPYLEGQALPAQGSFSGFAYDKNVNIHHNAITNNGTVEGNAAAGALAAGAGGAGGGVSICAGSDGYKLTRNWICGNYSSADGGGVGHIGLSTNGLIQNNKIIFNESYSQTGGQHGGGLAIEGEGATGTTLSLGTGNVTVDKNLILGNFARAGSGGGVRLASVNGADAAPGGVSPWVVTMTNNIITNNLAAWAGAGVSLSDTLFSSVVNNTIAMNDSTGIAGNLFSTNVNGVSTGPTTGVPNPAGISSELTTAPLLAALPRNQRAANRVSDPHLVNDIIWHNRSFFFTIVSGTTQLSPSNDWADAVAASKPAPLGAPDADGCVPAQEKYWDVGIVGDTNSNAAPTFAVGNSVLSSSVSPMLTKAYCNASRTLPGLQFEPGTPFQPVFNISASATLDESGNFVDLHFGPLSLMDKATGATVNGDYHLAGAAGSAYNTGTGLANLPATVALDYDNQIRPQVRPTGTGVDKGADEVAVAAPVVTAITPATGVRGATVAVTLTGLNFGGATGVTVSGAGVAVSNFVAVNATTVTATFTISGGASLSTRTVTLATPAGTSTANFTVTAPPLPVLTAISPASGLVGGTVAVTLTGSNMTGATVGVSGNNRVTASNVVVSADGNSLTVTLTIAGNAATGTRNITVTTGAGTSNAEVFTVAAPPPPVLTAISPASGPRGSTVAVTLTGSNLTAASVVTVSGVRVTVSAVTVVSASSVTATFAIATNAATGARTVTVTTPGGTSGTVQFVVQ